MEAVNRTTAADGDGLSNAVANRSFETSEGNNHVADDAIDNDISLNVEHRCHLEHGKKTC